MIVEFKLSDGREGTIEVDDMLIEIKGKEWADAYVKNVIAEREAQISKNQD